MILLRIMSEILGILWKKMEILIKDDVGKKNSKLLTIMKINLYICKLFEKK